MDIYREQLLDHYHHPRGWGLQDSADIEHRGVNPMCGDEVTIQLTLEGNTVQHLHFEAQGCVISVAAASLLHEWIAGKPREAILNFSLQTIEELLGTTLPPARVKCGLLALETVQQGLLH